MGDVNFYRTKYFKIALILIVGLVISLFQGPFLVKADSEPKTVKIGYYDNDIFQMGASEDAVKSGYGYEYYLKLSEYTGWRYEYVYGNFPELYQKLVNGEIDLIAGVAYKEERTEEISYPDIAMGNTLYNLLKRVEDKDITADPESISGHTIGAIDSAVADNLEIYLQEHSIDATVVRFKESADLFEAFDSGKVDLLATEGEGTNNRYNYEVLLTFGQTDFYLVVNKNEPELLDELNAAQESLFNDEPYYLNTLRSKYYASSVSAQALSNGEIEWLDSHDTLTVGYLFNYLPYCDMAENGQVTGIVKELIPNIFDSIGVENIKINYVGFNNYDDMIAAINNGEIDVAFPVGGGQYFAEQNNIYQTHPFVTVKTSLIFEKVVVNPNNATFAINGNNRIQYYYIKSNYPDAKIVEYDSIEDCLQAVMDEEVDCTTLNGLRANGILRNSKYNKLSVRQLTDGYDGYLGVSIGNEGLLRLLNRGIHILGADFSENIAYKYTKGLYVYSFADWVSDNLIGFLVFIILIVVGLTIILAIRIRNLKLKNALLENSNKTQLSFIDNVSAAMKEPINEIVGISQMASQVTDDERLISNSLETISSISGNMASVINDVVDLSQLDKKKLSLNEDKINIVDLIKEIENKYLQEAEAKNITFKVESKNITNKDVIVDKARLSQAVCNVVNNALQYTDKGGHVSLTVKQVPCKNLNLARFEFEVKDNGIGISDEFTQIVFEPFTREDDPKVGMVPGTGLGLSISKELVELMDGSIQLLSIKGKGTEVTITVDLAINYNSTK